MILVSPDSAAAPAAGGPEGKMRRIARMLLRFAPLLRPHRRRLALAAACMLAFILMELAAPWPIQAVIDGVLLDRTDRGVLGWFSGVVPPDRGLLLVACSLGVVGIAVLRGLFSYGQELLAASVGHQVVSALRLEVFHRLHRLSLTFHSGRRSGDLLVRLTGDVSMLREILVPSVLEGAARVLVLTGMLTMMALMDLTLTLIAVAMLPLLILATARYSTRIREVSREQRRKEGRIASVAGEALASLPIIQAYSCEAEISARFSRESAKSLSAGLRSLRIEQSLARLVEMTLAGGSCLVLWVGALRSLSGGLSPGELIVFLGYLRSLYRPVQALVRLAGKANKAAVCGERVLEILDSREEVLEAPDAIPAPAFSGEIVFEGVSFGYDPDHPVLHDVSFRFAPGERVGLVGLSGAGKSTIVGLLLRLHDPQRGRILVDGTDIRRFSVESYRRRIAVVMQEPFLLGVSVEENLRYGRPEATDEELREAARAAGAHEFLEALPEGYASLLGERGSSLSRGQQQRISLARAVLRGAPILVFDEPTTGLDARTEAGVLETLARIARGRTCVWIAHNLSQILDCHRAIVVRDGRIVESGPPSELLERFGAFRGLFGEVAR